MAKIVKFTLAVALAALSMQAQASNAINGFVQGFVTIPGGAILVFTTGTRTTPPACSNTSFPTRWAFSGTTAEGQAMLSILLSAYALHQPVSFYGTGTCTVLGDSETISSVVTNNLQ